MQGTVGVAVSRAAPRLVEVPAKLVEAAPALASSMDRLAMLLGAGLKEAGMCVGGPCFFFTMSL